MPYSADQRPISVLIQEVETELAFRDGVFPREVRRKRMTQGVADERMGRLRDVLALLKELQSRESAE